MAYLLLAWFYVLFALPQPVVNWANENNITIVAEGRQELLERCLDAGVEVRYRYIMRYCTKGRFWFDNCGDNLVEVRSVRYDPLKESYTAQYDRHGDDIDPVILNITSRSEAYKILTTIPFVELEEISEGRNKNGQDRDYLGVRIISDCRGSIGSSLLDISNLLTFGMIKINRFDSGWIAFYLNN